jgi:hypothetical protein
VTTVEKWLVTILCLSMFVSHPFLLAPTLADDTTGNWTPLPAVACHFTSRVALQGQQSQVQEWDWYWWRQPDRVETRDAEGNTGQIWESSKTGQITYWRVLHKDKRIIEYTPGDLRALGQHPDWATVTRVIDPTLLTTKLRPVGKGEILGRQAQRYQGQGDGVEFEIWWLEQEQVPALVRQVSEHREETLRLKEIYPLQKSPWTRSQIVDYMHLDYADLGDKESDPFVRSLLHGEGRLPLH